MQTNKSKRLTRAFRLSRAKQFDNRGNRHHIRFLETKNLAHAENAIRQHKQALDLTPKYHPKRAGRLHNLGIIYHDRWGTTSGDLRDLEAAIQYYRGAVALTPVGDQSASYILADLGYAYNFKYESTDDTKNLELALHTFQRVVCLTPVDHPFKLSWQGALGHLHQNMYKSGADREQLELSIHHFKEVVDMLPESDVGRPDLLYYLGMGYIVKYEITNVLEELNFAIKYLEEALLTLLPGHPDCAARLLELGHAYDRRYERTEELEDINMVIKLYERVLRKTHDSERATQLFHLGRAYGSRYQIHDSSEDLEMSFRKCQDGLDLMPPNHTSRIECLDIIASFYGSKYGRTGKLEYLNKALERYREALDSTEEGDRAGLALRNRNLGGSYRDLFQRTKDIRDLEKSIQLFNTSLEFTPKEDVDFADRLQCLGSAHNDRFEVISGIEDISLAIKYHGEACQRTQEEDLKRIYRLGDLGRAYHDRFAGTGSMEDLDRAIEKYEEAAELAPNTHAHRRYLIHATGIGFRDKYQRSKAQQDIDAAIRYLKTAIKSTPDDHADRVDQCHNLGKIFQLKYDELKLLDDLGLAIEQFQEALKRTPQDHIYYARRLQYHGAAHHAKFQRTKDPKDLEISIENLESSVKLTPNNQPDKSDRLYALGAAYFDRHTHARATTDFELAVEQFESSLANASSIPADRMVPGRRLLSLYAEVGDWAAADRVASVTMGLVPLFTSRVLQNSDKQHLLTQVVGLASDATAVALMAGKSPHEAIQRLELGRGVIIGSMSELRTDVSDLEQQHPELAKQFIKCRRQLGSRAASTEVQANQRHAAGQQLEETIQAVRKLPRFEQFLLPPTAEDMKAAAARGPIVIVNISKYRSDALIVDKAGFRNLPLPDLRINDIRAYARGPKADSRLLRWLWDTVAKPVLGELGFTKTASEGCSRRVWWIPTGPLSKFPIHAAGCHEYGSADSVMDLVISSYSPSIRGLANAQKSRPGAGVSLGRGKVVLVGMEELRYAPQEIDNLQHLCDRMGLDTHKPSPCLEEVLAALQDCQIFHFAGHGKTDPLDPLKSALLLSDEPLTVACLFESNLHTKRPFIAYLSACGTGEMKHDELIDEGLHLVGSFQLAGFQHVIGTLWEVNDRSCVDVAVETYEWIKKMMMRDDSVSEGLHRAVKSLRDKWVAGNTTSVAKDQHMARDTQENETVQKRLRLDQEAVPSEVRNVVNCEEAPLFWVPYVHFGI